MSKSRRTSDLVNAIFVNPDNSVNIHEGTQSPYFLLDTGAVVTPQQGMMFWDADRQTVGVQMNGVEARLGQDNFWYVKNQTGSDILKGTVVMAVGALGASSRILVAPMVADGSVEEQFLLGITAEDILNGEDGFVMNIGKIRGINTTQYGTQAGQILYCDPAVPGGLTITQPQAPNLDIPIAFTVDYKSNGTLAVRTLPGYHLGELHDVQIDTPVTDQILRYNNNRWENWTPTYLTTTPTLDQVTTAGNTTTNAITVGGLTVGQVGGSGTISFPTTTSGFAASIFTQYVNNQIVIQVGSRTFILNGSGQITTNFNTTITGSTGSAALIVQQGNAAWSPVADFNGSAGTALRVNTNGNVLIGTTTDNGYKLQVNGDASINTLTVGLGGGSVAINTAVGYEAAFSNTTGQAITAIGYRALKFSTGDQNTAVGSSSLANNTTGSGNVAIGNAVLLNNTTGGGNVAIGNAALYNNIASNNVAVGIQAAETNTTGTGITAIGYRALRLSTTAVDSTAVGYQSLLNNTANYNTAIGAYAMLSNTSGAQNIAVGFRALRANTTGQENNAVGSSALRANTQGSYNSALGTIALANNTTGISNNAMGYGALNQNITGSSNTAVGHLALFQNNASNNTAVGFDAARTNTSGTGITAIGYQALRNSTGNSNTAVGSSALTSNTTGASNTAIGRDALISNTTGSSNIAIGSYALRNNTVSNNIAIGTDAGYSNTTGTSNVFLGYQAGYNNTTESNKLYIANNSTTPLIYGDFSTGNVMIGTTVDAGYKLDVNGSGRFKGIYSPILNSEGALSKIINPQGAQLSNGTATSTGVIKFKIPSVVGNNYSNYGFVVQIGSQGGFLSETFIQARWLTSGFDELEAYTLGRNFKVRVGTDGTDQYLLIGETDSTWFRTNITLREFYVDYSYKDIDAFKEGWEISFDTDISDITINQTVTNSDYAEQFAGALQLTNQTFATSSWNTIATLDSLSGTATFLIKRADQGILSFTVADSYGRKILKLNYLTQLNTGLYQGIRVTTDNEVQVLIGTSYSSVNDIYAFNSKGVTLTNAIASGAETVDKVITFNSTEEGEITTDPLTVRNNFTVTGSTVLKGSGTTSATTALLVENSSATASLVVNDASNVLVGTTTDAGYKLDVNGTGRITGDFQVDGDFYQNGIQGYTGTFTIIQDAPNPPINVEVNGGIITNVT